MSSQAVEQIKERVDLVELISEHVKLIKAGKNFKGISPFTEEKTPSFFVSPDRGLYHCFSTGKGGDIFTFVQEIEGVDFRGALKLLAEKAGVELVDEDPKNRKERDRLYALLEEAREWFVKNREANKNAEEYLLSRGISKESIDAWKIGFALESWDSLHKHFSSRGYTDKELFDAGLIKKRDGKEGYYDVFRNRVVFPINDSVGRVVAFSGRSMPGDDTGAKYLNSPETILFKKSNILHGYDKAKGSIRKYDFSILVEGQMDLIMSQQAGFPNTVAVSGTALTNDHLSLLSRLSKKMVMAFDADKAGVASSGRSAMLALKKDIDVKVAALPEGVDPADMVKEDPSQWKDTIRSSKHVVDFYLDLIEQGEPDARKRHMKVTELVLPFVAQIMNAIDRAHFVGKIARRLSVPEDAVWVELKKVQNTGTIVHQQKNTKKITPPKEVHRIKKLEREIIAFTLWQEDKKEVLLQEGKYKETLQEIVAKQTSFEEKEREKLIFIAELTYGASTHLQEDFLELLREFTYETIKQSLAQRSGELRQAEARDDKKEAERLLKECNSLTKKMQEYASA